MKAYSKLQIDAAITKLMLLCGEPTGDDFNDGWRSGITAALDVLNEATQDSAVVDVAH